MSTPVPVQPRQVIASARSAEMEKPHPIVGNEDEVLAKIGHLLGAGHQARDALSR
jgi:hypothetical protein